MQLAIRYWRRKRGMKLRELAQRTGISYPMLSAYEIGTHYPSLPRLRTIANELNVTIDQLFMQPEDAPDATPTPEETPA